MIKTLPQTPFEDFAICIMLHNSLLVLPIFKTLSTCKHKLSVHQQSSMAQLEVQNSWHCSLALSPLPFPPSHTHIKGFVGTGSNLAPGWTLSRKHSIPHVPVLHKAWLCSPPNPSLQHPRLSNREQSGARFKGTLSLALS